VDRWSGRKALVTGGAGFIGGHVVRRLVGLGARVRVVDNLSRGHVDHLPFPDGVEFARADLTDPRNCQDLCDGIEEVFHFASKVGSIGYYTEKPLEVLAANIRIDGNVFSAAHAAGVSHFMYASSVFVYPAGRQASPDSAPLREEEAFPANPPISYGWAKLVGERLAQYACQQGNNFRAAVLRLMGVYGPGQDIDLQRGSIIPVLVRRAIEYPRLPFVIRGDGQESRSYCYVDDVVDAILLAIDKLATTDQRLIGPLNIGSDERVRIIDVAREIVALSGKEIEIEFVPGSTAVWGQAIDCSTARAELDGWAPRVSLREGLQRVFEDVSRRLANQGNERTTAATEEVR
jgi:nucleoside-diphosphate-sugar epimerase